jgi:hypothetical protein
LSRKESIVKRFAVPVLAAAVLIPFCAVSTAVTESIAQRPSTDRRTDCPVNGQIFGGGTAMGAAAAGWRHMIATDPVIEVQGRRYRRSRSNTPLVEVVQLGAVDIAMGPMPGARALQRMAKKRCPKSAPASRDSVWALVYHETLTTVCCNHWFLFAWRSKNRWHVY